jgi:hypothetical protein
MLSRRAFVLSLGSGALLSGLGVGCHSSEATSKDPKLILGRVWFSKLPKKRSDDCDVWIFLAGGIALYESGSFWRSSIELYEFERRGATLDIRALQDKKQLTTSFEIAATQDNTPFDITLSLKDSPRGPKKYYAFSHDEEMDAEIPWASGVRRAAEEFARGR